MPNITYLHFSNSGQLMVLAPRARCCFTNFLPTATLLESHSMTSLVTVHIMGSPLDRDSNSDHLQLLL